MSSTTALPTDLDAAVAEHLTSGVHCIVGSDSMAMLLHSLAVNCRRTSTPTLLVVPPRMRAREVAGTWLGHVDGPTADNVFVTSTPDATPAAVAHAVAEFDRTVNPVGSLVYVAKAHRFVPSRADNGLLAQVLCNIALDRNATTGPQSLSDLRDEDVAPRRPVVAASAGPVARLPSALGGRARTSLLMHTAPPGELVACHWYEKGRRMDPSGDFQVVAVDSGHNRPTVVPAG